MELNMDTFGQIMDEFLTKNEIVMQITLPEGTEEATIKSNVEAGVVELFILLKAIPAVWRKMVQGICGLPKEGQEEFADGILELIKKEMMEA